MNASSETSRERPREAGPRTIAWATVGWAFLFAAGAYLLTAYVLLPMAWRQYARRHPAFDSIPNISYDGDNHPGDPINLAMISSEADLHRAMHAAGWFPADPVTLRSSIEIALATVLRRPYEDAPVSPLYLKGRKQDFSFEQPIGDDPRRRHHVRFWKCEKLDDVGRPCWAGSATLDVRVGLSRTNGQITHHIGPNVDAERDHLVAGLQRAGYVGLLTMVPGFHTILEGKNGGGDPWKTDGRLFVVEIRLPEGAATAPSGVPAASTSLSADTHAAPTAGAAAATSAGASTAAPAATK